MTVTIEAMTAEPLEIAGMWRIDLKAATDERGTVREFFRASALRALGIAVPEQWAQMNLTWTHHGALRGLHGEAMTKLVGVVHGEAFGAYLDARPDSPTRATVVTVELRPGVQVLIPAGVCNGFQAVSRPGCQYFYCVDAEWAPGMPGVAVSPLDPALGIPWPIPPDPADPSRVSAKDATAPLFADL